MQAAYLSEWHCTMSMQLALLPMQSITLLTLY